MRAIAGALIGLPIVAAVAVPIERRFAVRSQRVFRNGWRTDVCYFVARPVLQLAGLVAALPFVLGAVAGIVPALLVRPVVLAEPFGLRAVEAFVLFDLIAYWAHRLLHEVPFLWRFHAVHHSSESVDWLATVRDHPLDHTVAIVPAFFLVVAGFPVVVVAASFAFVRGILAIWVHMNVRWQLRPLQKIVLTPAFHRWHHASDADALDHNYAGALPIWDVLFGTYFAPARDRRPATFGTATPVPAAFGAQLVAPFRSAQVAAGPV